MTIILTPSFDYSPPTIDSPRTNAITQTSIKHTSTQSLPIFDPSFFAQCKAFEYFSFHTIPF